MRHLTVTILIFSVISFCGCASKSPRPQTPIMGWSSWNHFQLKIDQQIIRSQADAMVSTGMKKAGYSYINIDDGYFGGRDKDGMLIEDANKFPAGMKNLADYIHSKGLKAGIYTDAGDNTCGSKKQPAGLGSGLYNHQQTDLALLLKIWGYDFLKVDWCGGKHLNLSQKDRYTEIGRDIRSLRPDVVYNVCCWKFPGKWVTSVADSWRVSGDIRPKFDSITKIIDLNAKLWPYAGPGHFNDMDMLQVGRGMSFDEDKTHFSMWCMLASPLLAGNDLTKMSPQTLSILTNPEIIAIDQDKLAYQARRLRDDGQQELWARPLKKIDSGQIAVALLNRSENPADIKFSLTEIGLDASGRFTVRDLWAHKDLKLPSPNDITFNVPAHGIVVLKITGKSIKSNPFKIK